MEDGDGDHILHHERFHLRKKEIKSEHIRIFEISMYEPTPPQYFIHVISDRWMHSKTTVRFSSVLLSLSFLFTFFFFSINNHFYI